MLNHIVIMGRMVRDPELRRTQSGISVCSFTLACDRDFKSKEQEPPEVSHGAADGFPGGALPDGFDPFADGDDGDLPF